LPHFLAKLTQTLGEQRMVLAQEAADDQGRIQILDLGELQTQPRRAGKLAISGKITPPWTEVDTPRTQAARQLLEQIQFFERCLR
jgi:hypothetical protein